MSAMHWMAVAGMVLFAGASFFFALAESALFSLGKWRAQQLAERSPRAGGRVLELLSKPQDLLAAIVLGNTFANAGLVAIALWFALKGAWLVWGAVGIVLLVILVGCEVIPKTMAVRGPEEWSRRLAGAVLMWQAATQPVRRIAQQMNDFLLRLIPKSLQSPGSLTDEEYQELLEMAVQQGALGKSEKEILLQIITLDHRTAKDVMKPRSQMACISDDLPVEEMISAAKEFKRRRLPIYDETPDTIVGILNTRVFLLSPESDLSESIEFPSFVPETMNLLQLFKSFRKQRRQMAIVLDEFGGTAGVVTMEDILEEVVGEIYAEDETREIFLEKEGEGRWRASGLTRLDDFRREYPSLPEHPAANTLGGLVVELLGYVPAQGEFALFSGLRLTAAKVDDRRVLEVGLEAIKRKGGS